MNVLRCTLSVALILLLATPPAGAWNEAGHRIIAAIAYDHLNPKARARVDDLIRRHPDYESIFLKRIPGDTKKTPGAIARAAFIAAAYWPDLIRSDHRFYTDTNPSARPTPLLPGFPDMGRHTNWHYYDISFSTDGTPIKNQPPPNALSEIERLLKVVQDNPDSPEAAYALPWLEHLIGDVHNPLHAVSRFLKSQPDGDQGGNLVIVADGSRADGSRAGGSPNGQTLHSLWDSAGGTDTGGRSVNRRATELTAAYMDTNPDPKLLTEAPKQWLLESHTLARQQVYTFGNGTGSKQAPLVLPAGYRENAHRVADRQLALAGLRLAEALNQALGQ